MAQGVVVATLLIEGQTQVVVCVREVLLHLHGGGELMDGADQGETGAAQLQEMIVRQVELTESRQELTVLLGGLLSSAG